MTVSGVRGFISGSRSVRALGICHPFITEMPFGPGNGDNPRLNLGAGTPFRVYVTASVQPRPMRSGPSPAGSWRTECSDAKPSWRSTAAPESAL